MFLVMRMKISQEFKFYMTKEIISNKFKLLQTTICEGLEELDGNVRFQSDSWERAEGGGGRTNTISNGKIIEKDCLPLYSAITERQIPSFQFKLNNDLHSKSLS